MIHVQMGQHDTLDVARADAERAQLWPDLLLALDAEHNFPAGKGMQRPAGFQEVRALAGIDHDDAVVMDDRPRIGR